MTLLDFDDVTPRLREAVEAKGRDYVYVNPLGIRADALQGVDCFYSDNGAPSCIVGHAVAALDPPTFEKVVEWEQATLESDSATMFSRGFLNAVNGESWDQAYASWVHSDDPGEDPNWVPPILKDEVARALSVAQTAQDGGLTWGEAFDFYLRIADGDPIEEVRSDVEATLKLRRTVARNNGLPS